MHIAESPAPEPWGPPPAMGGAAPIPPAPIIPVPIVTLGAVKGAVPLAAEGPSAVPPLAEAAPANLQHRCVLSHESEKR